MKSRPFLYHIKLASNALLYKIYIENYMITRKSKNLELCYKCFQKLTNEKNLKNFI